MRRPVGVKWILLSLHRDKFFSPAEWPLSPYFHPHSRGAIRFARCMLGVPDQPYLSRIRHDHFVSQLAEQATDPG